MDEQTKAIRLNPTAEIVLLTGKIMELAHMLMKYTSRKPVAVALHPETCPEFPYEEIFGMPVVRIDVVEKGKPFVVWGL